MNRTRVRLSLPALLLAASVACMPAARAATTCSATAPASLAFGTVSITGTTDVSATFNVTCNTTALALLANTKVRMCLNIGEGGNGGGNLDPRRMLNGFADPLYFQLYTDAARSQIWGMLGNATLPTPLTSDFDYSVPLLGGTQTKTFTIYGRVPTQTLVAGSFTNPFSGIHTSIQYRYNETLLGTAAYPASCVAGGAGGGTVSGAFPFTASATVPVNCRAYTSTALDFGSVAGLIGGNVDQTSAIHLTCTGRTAWQVGLDNGQHASGTVRRMRLGASAQHVIYELYSNPGRTVRWGNTIDTDTVAATGTGIAQSLTVYGRVPAPQSVAAGDYGDVVTITITY